jgi:hypothetical protein
MSMFCPQCHGSFAQRLHCPACGVRLEYKAQAAPRVGPTPGAGNPWQQTPWGRLLVGLLLAQGLYYGLWHLCKAGLLAIDTTAPPGVWTTLAGLLVLQALQAVSLVAGGSVAGAGKRQGVVYGALVGLVNGLISLLTLRGNSHLYSDVLLYGQPILHTSFGAAGGFLGVLVWRPLVPVGAPATMPVPLSAGRHVSRSPFAGPVAWFRVLTGIGVALGGGLWANAILDFILTASDGRLTLDSELQAQLVTWEIAALAMLLGSGIAGASTMNGLKQGLCVGLGTASVLLGVSLSGRVIELDAVAVTLTTAVILCLVGGWFGGRLFPPVLDYACAKGLSIL